MTYHLFINYLVRCEMLALLNEQVCFSLNAPCIHSGGPWVEYRSTYRLFLLRFIAGFLRPSIMGSIIPQTLPLLYTAFLINDHSII